ncbi:unnamed protein product [Closterium sp. NIES-53]
MLLRASRPAAARASRSTAPRVTFFCRPHVAPCCPAQRTPCCPRRPARTAPPSPSRPAAGGAAGAGGAGAGGTGGAAAAGPGGSRTGGAGPAGAGGVVSAGGARGTRAAGTGGAGVSAVGVAGAAGPGSAHTRGTGGAGAAGTRGACTRGVGAAGAGGAVSAGDVRGATRAAGTGGAGGIASARSPDAAKARGAASAGGARGATGAAGVKIRPALPVCTGRRIPRPPPPPVHGTHIMALPRATSPTVPRLLATVVTDPSFEYTAASALVDQLVDLAVACRLEYATSLLAEFESGCPPSVGRECALSTDVLEDRSEDFECLAAAVPHLVAMLLAPEGDPDAPNIPTPRSYAEAFTGPYSSQWQTAMDAKMASSKSTGTYVDAVPSSGVSIVDGKWIFRVKQLPISPPVFKARYVARGFSHRQGVDFFLTFSPTPKMTTLRVLQRFGFQYSSPQSTPLPTGHSLSAPPSDHTSGMGLVLGGRGPVVLIGHADASRVDDLATQRSPQGYTFSLGSGSVSWRSTRSSFVLSSSCEAEIYTVAMAAQELRWLTYLLTDLGERPRSSPVLYVDNKAMVALCQEHNLEHRTKHIALRYFLARELQQCGQLRLAYVATRANAADIFTKALPPSDHQLFPGAGGACAAGAGGAGAAGSSPRRMFFYPQPRLSLPPPDLVLHQVLSLPSSTGFTPPLLRSPADKSQPQLLPGSSLPTLAPHTEVTESLTERREPETHASTPVRARRAARRRPPAVPGTHGMTLRPSSVPQRVVLPEPPVSSLPHVIDPGSNLPRAASPTVTRLLATIVTDPDFESTTAFALVTDLVDFAARSRLVYVATLALRDYELHSLNFSRAFLHGSLHEEIWLRRPPGFTGTTLAALGFAPSSADPSLFLRTDTTLPPFYVLVYVDDLVFATADTEALALVLQRFGFRYSSPQSTPLPTGHSLSAPPSDESVEPSGPYPELVGCLMYLMTCTRPDLAYPLSLLACYVAPGRHRKATQRLSRGYTFSLGSGSLSWRSTRSSSVLGSSCDAEIYNEAMAAQELRWLTYLQTDLGERPRSPPVLYVNNKAMLALCHEQRLEHKTKHIALSYFLARELQQRRQLRLSYVASRANSADVFTKVLGSCDHQRLTDGDGGAGCAGDGGAAGDGGSDTAPAATAATTAAAAAPAYCATMASLRVLAFDHEGRPVQFDTWLDDLQLYLLSDIKDGVSLFDHVSGAATAPPTTADSATRSQWLSRDATARLAICNHPPLAECAHFKQHKTAQALYDAVVACYSSPATAALGRLLLPYLFPELSAFAKVEDLVSHLCASDARYRAAVPAEFLNKNQPPMFITLYFIVTRLPDSLRSVRDHFLSLDPTSLTVDLLEQHLLTAETSAVAVGADRGTPRLPFFEGCSSSPLAPSYASAAAADVSVAEDVGAASASGKRRIGKGKGGKGGGGGSGGGGGGSGSSGGGSSGGGGGSGTGGGSGGSGGGGGGSGGSGSGGDSGTGGGGTGSWRVGSGGGQRQHQQRRSETQSPQQLNEWFLRGASGGSCPYVIRTGDRAGLTCGRLHTQHCYFSRLDNAWRTEFGDDVKLPRWADLLKSRIAIFDLNFDAILSAIYALSVSVEGDCYRCVPSDPGIAAAALGASESGTLPGTMSAEALHTFTLDTGASACFFRDSTTLTPLSTPVPVRLADPSGGPVVARSSTVLPCPAVRSSSLSGLHLPSFSANLVSTTALQDAMVTTTTPGGQRVTICTCTRTGRHLATFTCRPGSSLYTLATEPPQVAASAQVSASGQVAAFGSCRLLSHQTLMWHHRLGHPSLPRLRGMHSRLLLRERFGQDLPVLRLHTVRGGEFSSNLLQEFCRGEGIIQSFTLPDSSQQNGIAEHRIGLVMEVARTSMIHAAAPHFLWPFVVRYAAHQLNLWPRVSLPETSPTPRWTGEVGDVTVFRVSGSRAFVCDTSGDKLSPRAIPASSLASSPTRLAGSFTTQPRAVSSLLRTSHPLSPQGPAPSGLFQVDPLPGPAPVQLAVGSGAARGAASGGAASGGAEPGGVESEGAETGGAEHGGVETGGAEPGGAGPEGVEPEGVEPGGAASEGAESRAATEAGGAGAARAGCARVAARAGVTGGTAATGPGGPRTRGTGATGAGGVEGVGAGDPTESGATGADGSGAGARGARVGGTCAGGAGVGGTGAGGARVVAPGGAVRPRLYFVPLLQPKSGGLIEHRETASRPVSPVHTARCVPRSRPPPVPGTHVMTLRPSSVPLRVPLPAPPKSSLLEVPDPESDCARAASPTVSRLLATAIIDPTFDSAAASALVAELLDFATACRLDYATALVAESTSASPQSVGGECALGTDVLEDRQEDFESPAAAVPRFASMLLAPEGDPDAPDIPTPRSYAEAIMGTYVDEVPPPGENIVDGMWIFREKQPPGSPPAFKARYVARRFSQRQGVDYFQTFSLTPKMTTLRLLLHVAAQRDYELHSLDFSIAFLQGSLHEEIWLRRPLGFTESFPAGTQWSLRLREAPRKWHDTLRTTLAALRFAPATADPSLFLRTDTSLPPFYVLVYVDDLVFATADTKALTLVKSELQKRHICTDLGELRSYLGLQITRDRARRTITLTQSHMDAAKRVLRYLCSTSGMGLVLGGRGPIVLTGHADASWVDDSATQRSSQGYTFSLGSGSVSLRSTRSSLVLNSSCEAEIYAGAMAAQELRWLTYLLTDLGVQPPSPLVLYVDNKAMTALC